MFQYISCCYLSGKIQLEYGESATFQYISCCYLSAYTRIPIPHNRVSIHLMLLFILSLFPLIWALVSGFNTSHVAIYRNTLQQLCDTGRGFNTSHVAIYLTTLRCFPFLLSLIFLYFSSFSSFFTSRTHFFIFSPKILCFSLNQGFYSGFLFFSPW